MSYHSTTGIDEKTFQETKDHPMKKLLSVLKDNPIFRFIARYSEDQYRPEKHYMRGPGPKAKAKAARSPIRENAFAKNASRARHS
jgi:hypothetical protein